MMSDDTGASKTEATETDATATVTDMTLAEVTEVVTAWLSTRSGPLTVQAMDLTASLTVNSVPTPPPTPVAMPVDFGDQVALLKALGTTATADEASTPLAEIWKTMDSAKGLIDSYSVLTGVVFLKRVAAQIQKWLSDKSVTPAAAVDLLNAALQGSNTTMQVGRGSLAQEGAAENLTFAFTTLCNSWALLDSPKDKVDFVSQNMNSDKRIYQRAIEGFGRTTKARMGVEDILMNQLHRNTNTNTIGGAMGAKPSTASDQLAAALGEDEGSAKQAVKLSLWEILGHIWASHFEKFDKATRTLPEVRSKLTLDAITDVVWAQWETIVASYEPKAHPYLRALCPDRTAMKAQLDESLTIWDANGDLEPYIR